jgi:hypothetical protein
MAAATAEMHSLEDWLDAEERSVCADYGNQLERLDNLLAELKRIGRGFSAGIPHRRVGSLPSTTLYSPATSMRPRLTSANATVTAVSPDVVASLRLTVNDLVERRLNIQNNLQCYLMFLDRLRQSFRACHREYMERLRTEGVELPAEPTPPTP